MSFLRRLFDFFASSAPTRDMPGPLHLRDIQPQEEWIVTPATGWTSAPLLMIRMPKYRSASEVRSAPARARSAVTFDRERQLLHRVDSDA